MSDGAVEESALTRGTRDTEEEVGVEELAKLFYEFTYGSKWTCDSCHGTFLDPTAETDLSGAAPVYTHENARESQKTMQTVSDRLFGAMWRDKKHLKSSGQSANSNDVDEVSATLAILDRRYWVNARKAHLFLCVGLTNAKKSKLPFRTLLDLKTETLEHNLARQLRGAESSAPESKADSDSAHSDAEDPTENFVYDLTDSLEQSVRALRDINTHGTWRCVNCKDILPYGDVGAEFGFPDEPTLSPETQQETIKESRESLSRLFEHVDRTVTFASQTQRRAVDQMQMQIQEYLANKSQAVEDRQKHLTRCLKSDEEAEASERKSVRNRARTRMDKLSFRPKRNEDPT